MQAVIAANRNSSILAAVEQIAEGSRIGTHEKADSQAAYDGDMELNPYEPPVERGYNPPTTPLLSVRQSAILFAAACGGVAILGGSSIFVLPPKAFGISLGWIVVPIELAFIGIFWLLLILGRSAGLVETPKARLRS
jgi:hypothetical protein